jgi:hypothetical protein
MIIPGEGLCYPFGNYANSPVKQDHIQDYTLLNYNSIPNEPRYFYRKFKFSNPEKLTKDDPFQLFKLTGTFVFDNLTKEQFESDYLTLEIKVNDVWKNCKLPIIPKTIEEALKNEFDINRGILKSVIEDKTNNKLYVNLLFDNPISLDEDPTIYFKLGLTKDARNENVLIKKIELI